MALACMAFLNSGAHTTFATIALKVHEDRGTFRNIGVRAPELGSGGHCNSVDHVHRRRNVLEAGGHRKWPLLTTS